MSIVVLPENSLESEEGRNINQIVIKCGSCAESFVTDRETKHDIKNCIHCSKGLLFGNEGLHYGISFCFGGLLILLIGVVVFVLTYLKEGSTVIIWIGAPIIAISCFIASCTYCIQPISTAEDIDV